MGEANAYNPMQSIPYQARFPGVCTPLYRDPLGLLASGLGGSATELVLDRLVAAGLALVGAGGGNGSLTGGEDLGELVAEVVHDLFAVLVVPVGVPQVELDESLRDRDADPVEGCCCSSRLVLTDAAERLLFDGDHLLVGMESLLMDVAAVHQSGAGKCFSLEQCNVLP